MRIFVTLLALAIPLAAQNPFARIVNTTRPGSPDFQIGDRFEVLLAGPADQPVSVRTSRQGRTDWGPAVGRTGANGRWSTSGQFEKADFGSWTEVWTVGGKLANPVVSFWVAAPCIPGGKSMSSFSGPNVVLTCDTAAGEQTFATPSTGDDFRTPDGRVVTGTSPSAAPQEQYFMQIMEYLIGTPGPAEPGQLDARAGDLITKMIGVNALTEAETKKTLLIVRAAYQPDFFRATEAEKPAMLSMLGERANQAERESLKKEILDTINFVRTQ